MVLVIKLSKFLYFAECISSDSTSRFPVKNEGWNNITENDGSKTFFFRPHIYGPKSQNLLLILTNLYRIRGKLASNLHSAVGGLWSVVLLDLFSLYLCLPPYLIVSNSVLNLTGTQCDFDILARFLNFVCLEEINAWMFVYRFLPVLFSEGNFSRETGSLNYKSNSSRKTKFRSIFRLGPRFHYYSNFDFSKPKWCEWYNEAHKNNLGTVLNCFLTLFRP